MSVFAMNYHYILHAITHQCESVGTEIFGEEGHVVLKVLGTLEFFSSLQSGQVDLVATSEVTYKLQYNVHEVWSNS